jgi:serine/threonine protein kinase
MDMPPDNDHLTLAAIRGYASGSHRIDDSQRIVDHLACCSECRAIFVREMQDEMAEDLPAESESLGPVSHSPDSLDIVGYREIRPLGQGGMGTIYSAVQDGTQRKVAIKCITDAGDQPVSAERTGRAMREARALACLDHPNIVSVLEVLMVRGLPAVVMEYVSGMPLDAWIKAHRPSPIAAAKIAGRLADAVAHAHQRGVLHYDLKPQNVLVEDAVTSGDADEPAVKLIDFGLAKICRDDLKITQAGDIIGSPSYMAPEQASGAAIDPSPAIDIYGIGTILYELLTGRPPFVATDRTALIAQLLAHPPPRPGMIAGPIPKDLETVCLKCLEKAPADRYADAESLASDLRSVILDEPISGKRPGPWKRGLRWAGKNRILAGTLAGTMLLGTIAASVAAYQSRANRSLVDEAIAQARLKATAELRAEQAEQAVIEELRMGLREMSRQAFGSQPEVISKQADSLQAIAGRWKLFATRLGDDPRSQSIRAEAHLRLGTIHSILGKRDAAIGELGQAEELLDNLVSSDPSVESRMLLAETYGMLAKSAHEQGDAASSIANFQSALTALNPDRDDSDPKASDRNDWARIQLETRLRIDFGTLLTRLSEFDQAKGQLSAANGLLEKAEVPAAYRDERAVQQCRCANRLAMIAYAQGDVREAMRILEQSSDLLTSLLGSPQSNTEVVDAYALQQTLLGKCLMNNGQPDQAREHLENAIRTQRQLIRGFPSVPLLRSQLATNLSVLGVIEFQRGDARAAIDRNAESFEILKELIERDPGDIGYRSEQIFALSNLVTIYTSIEQFSDATALAPKLLAENRELWKTGPDRIERLHGLAVALNTVGHLYIKVEEPDKAEPLFIEAEGIFGDLIDRVPTSDEFRRGLAMVRFGLAESAYKRQQWTQAVDLYSEAIAAFLSQKAGLGLPDRG